MKLHSAIHTAILNYTSAIAANSKVYNGQEYVSPFKDKKIIGDPYYLDYDWQDGQVFYDGQLYEQVPLRYDIFEDKLLIEFGQGYESIELKSEKLRYFKLNEQLFVKLSATGQAEVKDGFYEELHAGEVSAYVKRLKTIQEITDENIMKVAYVEKQKYFLKKNEHYYSVSNKKDILKVFADQKTEMKRFYAQQNLNFKLNPEQTLMSISKYNELLNKQP